MKKNIITSLLFVFLAAFTVQAQEPKLEFGRVTINHLWMDVSFTQNFTDPVVIVGPPTRNGGHKSTARVRNVTSTGFQVRIQEWDYHDQWHMFEDISFMVVERGRHTMPNGTVLEAGSIDLTNSVFKLQSFSQAFPTKPAIFASIVTNNDPSAVTERIKEVSVDGFKVKMQEEEASDNIHGTETLNFIAVEKAAGTIGAFEYLIGTDQINHKKTLIEEVFGFTDFFADMQTTNGGNTATVRISGVPEETLTLYIEEEKSDDREVWHVYEEVAWLAFKPKEANSYFVTFAAGPNGTVEGNLNQTVVEGGDATPVEAKPAEGYKFSGWSDGSTENPRTIKNVTASISVTAVFVEDTVVQPPVNGTFLSQDFTHDDLNRRDTVTLHDGHVWNYDYGPLGNLTQAHLGHPTDPQQDKIFNYTYDDIGNRKTASEPEVSKVYTANDILQYTEVDENGTVKILTYDDAGNPDQYGDWTLAWDGEDRLKSLTHSITGQKLVFGYDFRGFRVWKKVFDSSDYTNPTNWVGYVYDGNLVTEEIDLLDPNKKIIRSYTWGLDPAGTQQQVGGIGALVSMEETQADNSVKTFHVVSDAGGNVTNLIESHSDGSLTMANTYEYGPFGQVIAKTENVDMPYQFNTKYTDEETGLVYYGYRFYDAGDGRWLNRDPIGVEGGINVYNSVSNNMVNGFSGGLSYAGGMERFLGDLRSNYWLDAWGYENIETDVGKKPKNGLFDYRPYVNFKLFYRIHPAGTVLNNRNDRPWLVYSNKTPRDGATAIITVKKGCVAEAQLEAIPLVGIGNLLPSGSKPNLIGVVQTPDSFTQYRKPQIPVPKNGFPRLAYPVGEHLVAPKSKRHGAFEPYYYPFIEMEGYLPHTLWNSRFGGKTAGVGATSKFINQFEATIPVNFTSYDRHNQWNITKDTTYKIGISLVGKVRKMNGQNIVVTRDTFKQKVAQFKLQFIFK